jgi:hypothetical protein
MTADSTQFAVDMALHAIDRINFLRENMEEAVRLIVSGKPARARQVLDRALEETEVGKMKIWQSGEEPF